MRGHVYKRGTSYTYVIDLSPDPLTGKRRQKSKGGFEKEKEAETACAIEIANLSKSDYVEDTNMTYEEFLYIWLEDYAEGHLKPGVYASNKVVIEKRIIPVLGNRRIQELKPLMINRFYNSLSKKYSPDYIKTIHSIVSKTLRQAYKWDLLDSNIMDKVNPPKVPKKTMPVWTFEQCQHFLKTSKENQFYIIFSLAIWTGMRRGEVLGLRWSDINFDRRILSVQQTVSWVPDIGIVIQQPKTSNSIRTISIPEQLLVDLQDRQKAVQEMKEHYGDEYKDHDLVCCYKDGMPIKPRMLLKVYHDLIPIAELPRIRFHDLRHSHASMLIKWDVHTSVGAQRLGQTPSVFSDTYAHVIESMEKEVASTIDEAIKQSQENSEK